MLTNKVVKRVELPHEPGEWVEVRMPSMLIMDKASDAAHPWMGLLEACILSWSYEEPPTAEAISELDSETVHVLNRALLGGNEEATKNA